IRITIKKSYPPQAIDLDEFPEQGCNSICEAEILSICHSVLRHDDELANSLFSQAPGLVHKVRRRPAAKTTAEAGNCAKRTDVIAALGNFQIGHVRRRRENAWDRRNFC